MGSVILDDVLSDKLRGGGQSVEVVDANGKVVGHYLTHDEYVRMMYDFALSVPTDEATKEEARREIAAGGGVTTAMIMERFAENRRKMEAKS